MLSINPIKLEGPWKEGWALDLHSISSYPFKRSKIGEMLYNYKYKKCKEYLTPLAETAVAFLKTKEFINEINIIVPIPPSIEDRTYQPVFHLALEISERLNLGIQFKHNAIKKIKSTEAAKRLKDPQLKEKILFNSFKVEPNITTNKIVLLIDDITGSGATLKAATKKLIKEGRAKEIYVFTFTQNRVKK